MLIGFDFDSVIVDTGICLCGILTERFGTQVLPENINYYKIEHNFPQLSPDDVRDIINETCGMDGTMKMPPMDGAFDFLRWYAQTKPIYIITNREDLDPVMAYCQHTMAAETYGNSYFFHSKDKGTVCKRLGITHFIDDCVSNLINLANHGIIPMMFIRNWNVDVFTGRELFTELIRFIYSWEDVYGIVQCEQENII